VSQLPIDINYRYQSNWAPLHYAAMHSSIQIISRLINDPRIDANALTDFHETPLHIAAKANKLENCLLLMSAGVCIDKRDCDQNTALHYATEYGYRDIVQALLENGASPLIKNCTGMTAIELASANLADLFGKYKEKQ
jgi:ankyrin repeat protein